MQHWLPPPALHVVGGQMERKKNGGGWGLHKPPMLSTSAPVATQPLIFPHIITVRFPSLPQECPYETNSSAHGCIMLCLAGLDIMVQEIF